MPRGKQLPDDAIERLVGLVRERPFIYDAKDDSHMDAQKMSNAWESIAKTLKVEGLDGKAWRGKWKNLRDSYMKQRRLLKETKSDDAAKEVNKWKFFDILSFLEPYIAENEADTNVPDVEETDDNDSYTGTQSVHEDNRSEVSSFSETLPLETAPSSVSPTPSTSTGRVGKTLKRSGKRHLAEDTSSIEAALTDFINESKKNHKQLQGNTETNPDELLFASYANRMKELPKETQAFIKLQMSQLFFKAENQSGVQIPVTPLPPRNELPPSFAPNVQYANKHLPPISTHYEDTGIRSHNECVLEQRPTCFLRLCT